VDTASVELGDVVLAQCPSRLGTLYERNVPRGSGCCVNTTSIEVGDAVFIQRPSRLGSFWSYHIPPAWRSSVTAESLRLRTLSSYSVLTLTNLVALQPACCWEPPYPQPRRHPSVTLVLWHSSPNAIPHGDWRPKHTSKSLVELARLYWGFAKIVRLVSKRITFFSNTRCLLNFRESANLLAHPLARTLATSHQTWPHPIKFLITTQITLSPHHLRPPLFPNTHRKKKKT
jgi:hypothetical protein